MCFKVLIQTAKEHLLATEYKIMALILFKAQNNIICL